MKVLSIDTATSRGSVSLLEGSELVAELRLQSPETHSARLLRSIEFLLANAGWELAALELVAAGIGPGSFTGIRIGVATGLGLAQALSLPFAGISCMDALARRSGLPEGRLGIVRDAQRAQVYYAEYTRRYPYVRREVKPFLCHPGAWREQTPLRGLHLVGDGVARYRKELGVSRTGWPRHIETDLFLSGDIGRLAHLRKRFWLRGDSLQAEPLYIRPPDAMRGRRLRR
jgi:tRNA threonylcarbamoyladenosine biosynthesis protein TsaB